MAMQSSGTKQSMKSQWPYLTSYYRLNKLKQQLWCTISLSYKYIIDDIYIVDNIYISNIYIYNI